MPPFPTTHPRPRRAGLLVVATSVLAAAVTAVTATPARAGDLTPDATVKPGNRASVLAGYQKVWSPAVATASGWTGSTSSCTAGTDSAAGQQATLDAVNFVRALAGRPKVGLDPTLSSQALAAALIQDANGSLSHSPPSSSACWTQAGADASGRSNLFLNGGTTTGGASIAAYMSDGGDANNVAGHRRWILFSRQHLIGSGTTARANALYVLDTGSWLAAPAGSTVAAWPSAGWFPAQLEPDGKWSVSIPDADFGAATVTVTHGGKTLPVTVLSRTDNGYGDNTLVWRVDPRYDISQGDQAYTVKIAGYTVGGVGRSTKYTTTLFDATVGMKNRNVISFPFPADRKVGKTFDPGATNNNGLTVYYYSNTPSVCRVNFNPSTVTTLAAGTCSVFAYVGHDDRYPDAPYVTRTFQVTP